MYRVLYHDILNRAFKITFLWFLWVKLFIFYTGCTNCRLFTGWFWLITCRVSQNIFISGTPCTSNIVVYKNVLLVQGEYNNAIITFQTMFFIFYHDLNFLLCFQYFRYVGSFFCSSPPLYPNFAIRKINDINTVG